METRLIRPIERNDLEFPRFGSFFDRVFHNALANVAQETNFIPQTDVVESEKGFEVHLSVPGFKKEDFKIELHKNTLSVSAERKFVKEENKTYHRIESYYGSFTRTFHVPDGTKLDDIKAEYKDGILAVNIPRDEVKPVRRQISIN